MTSLFWTTLCHPESPFPGTPSGGGGDLIKVLPLFSKDLEFSPKELEYAPKKLEFAPKEIEFALKEMEFAPKELEFAPNIFAP